MFFVGREVGHGAGGYQRKGVLEEKLADITQWVPAAHQVALAQWVLGSEAVGVVAFVSLRV